MPLTDEQKILFNQVRTGLLREFDKKTISKENIRSILFDNELTTFPDSLNFILESLAKEDEEETRIVMLAIAFTYLQIGLGDDDGICQEIQKTILGKIHTNWLDLTDDKFPKSNAETMDTFTKVLNYAKITELSLSTDFNRWADDTIAHFSAAIQKSNLEKIEFFQCSLDKCDEGQLTNLFNCLSAQYLNELNLTNNDLDHWSSKKWDILTSAVRNNQNIRTINSHAKFPITLSIVLDHNKVLTAPKKSETIVATKATLITTVQPQEKITHEGNLIIDTIGEGASVTVRNGALTVRDIGAFAQIDVRAERNQDFKMRSIMIPGNTVQGLLYMNGKTTYGFVANSDIAIGSVYIGNVKINDRIFTVDGMVEKCKNNIFIIQPISLFVLSDFERALGYVLNAFKKLPISKSQTVTATIDGRTYTGTKITVQDHNVTVENQPLPLNAVSVTGKIEHHVKMTAENDITINTSEASCEFSSESGRFTAQAIGNANQVLAWSDVSVDIVGAKSMIISSGANAKVQLVAERTTISAYNNITANEVLSHCELISEEGTILVDSKGADVKLTAKILEKKQSLIDGMTLGFLSNNAQSASTSTSADCPRPPSFFK